MGVRVLSGQADFPISDGLFEHEKSAHQDRIRPRGATEEEMRRLRSQYEANSLVKRTPKSESPSAKDLPTQSTNRSSGISPGQTKSLLLNPTSFAPPQSLSGLQELNIGTPREDKDITTRDVSEGNSDDDPQRRAAVADGISAGSDQPRKRAAVGYGISAGTASHFRGRSASPPPRLSKARPTSAPGPFGPETESRQLSMFDTQRPHVGKKQLWSPDQDDSFDIVLQPETRPISQEQLVAEVKGIYASLVMVEAKCIEVDKKQAALAHANRVQPKLNNEQWQGLITLHRTLLHEHHNFFLASQHPSASPALRRLASKYSMLARMWRHNILSFLYLLKDRLPASLDDIRHKLAFMELAYTMMDLLHEVNPAFEDTWTKCLADFNRHLSSIRNNYKDTTALASLIREWYSDLSNNFSVALSYVPKVYAKSSFFFRKAIRISVNGKECLARPDSGSEKDVCSEAFANQHGLHISQNDEDKILFKLGTKTEVRSIGRTLVSCGLASDTNPPEERWFCVLKKCVAPIIMGEQFIKKIRLCEMNKHLLVRCPNWFGRLSTLKYIGSPNNQIRFKAGGHALNACADTGSDEDFMSLDCAKRNGFKIDRRQSRRIVIQQADGSIVKTVGQVRVSVKIGLMDEFKMNFHVLSNLSCEVIFCEEFLEQTDGFKNLVESSHVSKDDDAEFQEASHALNTLINLDPINAYVNRSRTTVAENTSHQEHDNAIVAEIYRRNKANKAIPRISDGNKRLEAEEIESVRKNQSHAECAICIQRINHETSSD